VEDGIDHTLEKLQRQKDTRVDVERIQDLVRLLMEELR
jgi:hypothetical protein